MLLDNHSVRWPKAVALTVAFALVAGICQGTHYEEHHFLLGRWLTDVAGAAVLPGVCFGFGLAVESLAVTAGVMGLCTVIGLAAFAFWTLLLGRMEMAPDLALGLACVALGRLFRDDSIRRGQFRLQTLLLLPILVATAAWLAWLQAVPAFASTLIAAAAVVAALAGYRLVRETLTRRERWRDALLLTLGCLYLPFAWVVLIRHPWDGYRLTWLGMWPVLPGGMGAALSRWLTGWRPSEGVGFAIAGTGTLLLIGLCSWFAQRGRWSTIVAAMAALALAGFTSLAAHAAFRM